jgi:hypothetical protein
VIIRIEFRGLSSHSFQVRIETPGHTLFLSSKIYMYACPSAPYQSTHKREGGLRDTECLPPYQLWSFFSSGLFKYRPALDIQWTICDKVSDGGIAWATCFFLCPSSESAGITRGRLT